MANRMLPGFVGILLVLVGFPLGLNYKGLADRYFNHLARTHHTLPSAKPWNIRLVGWAAVFIGICGIAGGFSGVLTAS